MTIPVRGLFELGLSIVGACMRMCARLDERRRRMKTGVVECVVLPCMIHHANAIQRLHSITHQLCQQQHHCVPSAHHPRPNTGKWQTFQRALPPRPQQPPERPRCRSTARPLLSTEPSRGERGEHSRTFGPEEAGEEDANAANTGEGFRLAGQPHRMQ